MSKEKDKDSRNQGTEVMRASDRGNGRQNELARRGSASPTFWGGDPFRMMRHLAEEMDRVFDDFGIGRGLPAPWGFGRSHAPAFGQGSEMSAWSPQVEIFEREGQLVVRADLPGLNKNDVRVEVTDDAITIEGERRHEHEERREGYIHSERSYGSFSRRIPLPDGVEADKANANFRDGVLEISMPAPKREPSRSRRIEVKG